MLSLLIGLGLAAGWGGDQATPPDGQVEAEVVVVPYSAPLPQPDLEALVFLAAQPRERHVCKVTAVVDAFGEVLDVVPTKCPEELRQSAVDAVRRWGFHPPMQEGQAVKGHFEARLLFVSHSVVVPEKGRKQWLVRADPVAVPRWPSPPKARGEARAWMEGQGVERATCVLDFSVDKRNAPRDFELVDCPEPLAQPLMRRLKRYGIDVDGAEPGDGKVYRLEWVYRL